jgi:hypothetical protein
VVPNYPLSDALVCGRIPEGLAGPGAYRVPLFYTNPYGFYELDFLPTGLGSYSGYGYAPAAARYGPSGLIEYYKDHGTTAQNFYRSVDLRRTGEPVNLILFRSTAVALLNRINPQTMREFSDAQFLRPSGLVPFPSHAKFISPDGILDFVDPAEHFYLALKAGAAENELVAATRAFCLGVGPDHQPSPDREIEGAGYLAADVSIFRNLAQEAANSMIFLNDRRIRLQKPFGMIDEMTDSFHRKAIAYREAASAPAIPALQRNRTASNALVYAILNHPVIRGSISEAIWGILWYMGLLVPFVFFFEKLVFGCNDLRKQLAAQGAIFLVVFALLRILHPAFQMIRSSFMILLGFIIILVSGGVTVLLSGKFRENLEALHKLSGRVKGAQVNKSGIMLTAFMLGLNNMHRRKVRTGLTCATLVLMTFVMICFTSVQTDIVDRLLPVARAPYQGMLIKNDEFRAVTPGEIAALNRRYGEWHTVNERIALVGARNPWSNELVSPEIEIVAGIEPDTRGGTAYSVLMLRASEPLRQRIELLTQRGWFTPEQAASQDAPYPILLPSTIAESLRITPEAVDADPVPVRIAGRDFYVHGIFNPESLAAATDLDLDNLLPFDSRALAAPKSIGTNILAERDDPRVAAADILIGLVDRCPISVAGERRLMSAAVDMGNVGYREARERIEAYLEQSGRATNYGLDGIAYLGRRARQSSLAGLGAMVIPLIIAALTVLNTMKGSVYERREEIFVYNAVGIAPRYVFFMFMAEATVYAVVGALLGYILSQGTGRILTILDWTGGMNMNFTSLATVYASLTIVAATFLSTYFPARSAMEIAKPTEDAGWSLPVPKADDILEFALPFTFTHYDRIAVLGFFHRFLVNHGEGSAGPFYAGQPVLGVADHRDPLADQAVIPTVEANVWLKPFDLGVSQRLVIELPTDEETGEYISRLLLCRLTGTREAWLRLNRTFTVHIRRHFLHWRAVSEEMKAELHSEAQDLLRANLGGAPAAAAPNHRGGEPAHG